MTHPTLDSKLSSNQREVSSQEFLEILTTVALHSPKYVFRGLDRRYYQGVLDMQEDIWYETSSSQRLFIIPKETTRL